jgi:hypothetical protein
VIVNGHREGLLRALLADHVVVEDRLDLRGLRDRRGAGVRLVLLDLLRDDVVAEADALVADVDRRAGNELLHFLLRFAAEGAVQVAAVVIVAPTLHVFPRISSTIRRRCLPKHAAGKLRPHVGPSQASGLCCDAVHLSAG